MNRLFTACSFILSSLVRVCVLFQSEEDFLEESDFDDISIHSASVLSDTSGAATKKKARRGRKKRKSMFTVYTRRALRCVFSLQIPIEIPQNQTV